LAGVSDRSLPWPSPTFIPSPPGAARPPWIRPRRRTAVRRRGHGWPRAGCAWRRRDEGWAGPWQAIDSLNPAKCRTQHVLLAPQHQGLLLDVKPAVLQRTTASPCRATAAPALPARRRADGAIRATNASGRSELRRMACVGPDHRSPEGSRLAIFSRPARGTSTSFAPNTMVVGTRGGQLRLHVPSMQRLQESHHVVGRHPRGGRVGQQGLGHCGSSEAAGIISDSARAASSGWFPASGCIW